MMLKKKIIAFNATVVLGIGSFVALPAAQAEVNPVTQAEVNRASAAVNKVHAEISTLNERIARVDQAVKDNTKMISDTETKIVNTNKEVQQLDSEIKMLQDRIEKRSDILKKRALSYQETNGTSSYLEVLLGSTSFADFFERIGAVSTIVNADKTLIQAAEDDQKELEDKQAAVKKKLNALTNMKTELLGMQADIKEQQKQNELMKEELTAKEAEANRQLADAKAKNIPIVIEKPVASVTQVVSSGSNGVQSSNKPMNTVSKPVNKPSSSKPSSSKPSANKNIQAVINAGYKYIGNSVYVFGGGRTQYDIDHGRFDCSGFVSWAFRQGGYSVPASTDALKGAGRRVPASQMQPGDMVFFDTYKKDGHVGIYIGGGKFIGSQSSTGVAIANMSSGYWKDTFNGRVVRVH